MSRTLGVAWVVLGMLLGAGGAQAAVVINELHYHPSDSAIQPPENPEHLQFLELYNSGASPVDITGWSITEGVQYTFPLGTTMAAGEYVLVAEDPTLLRLRVPAIPAGVRIFQWTAGDLDNGGELVRLVDGSSNIVDELTYNDAAPWPTAPDGTGPSLELLNPAYDNAYALVWRASTGVNGTPGTVNSVFTENPVVLWETPARNSVVSTLPSVTVMFAESVRNVVAADLKVNSMAATSVTCSTCAGGVGAGPYVFSGFPAPTANPVPVTLGPGAIQDTDGHSFGGDSWIYFQSVPKVVINELHYNPPGAGDLEEFVELYNAEPTPVDIGGWTIVDFASPGCAFPLGTTLPAGGYVVCAKDPTTLYNATGFYAPYTWGLNDSLSNDGETVTVKNAYGVIVDQVLYDDVAPWPTAPDGNGPSLELVNPSADNSQGRFWKASNPANITRPPHTPPYSTNHGTPGSANSTYSATPLVASEAPARGAVVSSLTAITVTFSEIVTGVSADDLTVDGVPATSVEGTGAGPYVFAVAPPAPGVIDVVLQSGGIQSQGGAPFAGDSWQYYFNLPKILFNEIHYHAAPSAVLHGEDPEALQFIELYNNGSYAVDLAGFEFSQGIRYTFPAGTILAPGAFLVVAQNPAFLQSKVVIPGGVPVLQWTSGDLANGGELIELIDPYGNTIDAVTYDDGGEWPSAADGEGPSLELVNPNLPNQYGAAWKASLVTNGTPGAPNGRYVAAPAPIISAVRHWPPIPGAGQPVTLTVLVLDDAVIPTVTLQYRQDQEPTIAYTAATMFDDGLHGDGAAGDNVYGLVVAGLGEMQRLDFAIQASDGVLASVAPSGHDGVFPGAGGHPPQVYLCKFSSAALPTDFPSYHLITTQYTRNRQDTRDKTEYDATFIRCPMTGLVQQCEVFYNVREHFRGASSLYQNPPSFRIDLPDDHPMESEMGFTIENLDMLSQQPARQGVGYGLFDAAGLLAPSRHYTRFNTCPLTNGGTQNYIYTNVERIDKDFFTSHDGDIVPPRFPNRCSVTGTTCLDDVNCPSGETCIQTDNGNCYRGRHDDASLRFEGFNPDAYRCDASERNGYQKITNDEEDNWTDLITLCDAMDCSTSDGGLLCTENTYDGWFQNNLRSYGEVEQWARWYAVHMLLDNQEGGIYRDTGDDYFIYFWPGPQYNHMIFLPWDMDAIIPSGHETIWRTGYYNANWPVRRMLRNNAYAGLFVGAICEYMDTAFSQATMNALIDSIPDTLFPTGTPQGNGPQTKQGMKDWVTTHRQSVNNEIRRQTTLVGIPASPYTNSNPVIALSGQLNQCWAREVRVNGLPANYTIANPDGVGANWSYNFTLTPGMNHILVQTLNHSGAEIDRAEGDVFYNPPGAQNDSLRLILPRRMYNQKTMTIAADIINVAGGVDWKVWEAVGTVSIVKLPERTPVAITTTQFDPHITDPNGSIRFYNGRGTVSFTLNDGAAAPAGIYELKVNVTVNSTALSGTTTFTVLSAPAFRTLSGTLSGADLTWGPDEEIHLTGSVTAPAGTTLTINPGTLIMIDAGSFQSGTLINVYGSLNAVGTQANPIFIFPTNGAPALALTQSGSASNGNCWRGIDLYGTGTSTMRWVFLTGAGNGDVISHPRPPIVATRDRHTVNVDYSFFIDNDGMVFSAPSPGLFTIRNCVFQRAGIGSEFQSDGNYLLLEDSYFARIGHAPEANNLDGDHLHIDGGSSNQTIRRCIFSDGGDDGIDHVASTFTVQDVIIHDIRDKCISMTGGLTHLKNFLCFASAMGVRGTGDGEHVTINVGSPIGGIGGAGLTESIIWPSSICSANLSYSDVGNSADAACGTANFSSDPLFKGSHDFDLQPGSPALTAGIGGTRIGWLGFPYAATCNTAADCNDSNACTYDECINHECSYTPIANCATCESNAQCDDGNACTDDTCDLGACRHANNTAACDDLSACTAGDHCSAGVCVGTTVNCNDSSACTTDTCNPATGCVYTPITCNDNNPCTDDSCEPGSGCRYTADNTNPCTDAVACTNDVCSAGSCVSTDNCAGGLTCNHTTGQCTTGPRTAIFQQGANGYTGTQDTYLYENAPNTVEGALDNWRWDTENPAPYREYGLVRFDNIIGSGPTQIPQGSTISSATLTLEVFNASVAPAGNVNEVTVDWSQAATTYNNFGGDAGVQSDEYNALTVASAPIAMGTVNITVTSSLQAWANNPAANLGWIFIPNSTDGVQVRSSEYATLANRPLLTVTYYPPVGSCTSDPQCDDGLWCNGAETCNLGTSTCQAGTPPNCADTVACTTDSCNETSNSCDHVANNAACDDSNVCTDDTCNVTLGCQHANNTASCSDNNACTTGDVCSGGTCQAGAPLTCNDNIACTTDSCVPASGCQYVDNCTGGQACNHTTGVCESGPVTITFQQGVGAYTGAVDTYIDSALGSQATTTPIVVDGSPAEHVLIRFDGIFGSGASQIPQGSTIVSATLTLRVGSGTNDQSENPVNFHRLLHPWIVTDVWAAYGVSPWNSQGGIQADGVDALVAIEATATMITASTAYPVSVTGSVQAWSTDPASNYGWAILPTGTDGLRLESSESATASYRPLLSVTYTPPVSGCTSDPQCDDGLWCNGTEVCNLPTQTCQPGSPPICADAVACTTDSCNETTNSCDHAPNNAACSDGNVCTDDTCDVALGCQHTNNTAACSDNNACTTGDVCSGGTCLAGTSVTCNDNIACTTDSCVPASGCQYVDNCPTGQSCNYTSGVCETSAAPPLPINVGDTWKYLKGTAEPSTSWTAITFDDATWLSGPSGFGYGTDCQAQHATVLSDMLNGYVSVYLRKQFRVDNPAAIATLTLTVDYDDAFVAYINGSEVARRNVTGTPPSYTQLAIADHECSQCNAACNPAENIDLTAYKNLLVAGTNVLTIQAHNLTLGSSDFTITPSMSATTSGTCTSDPQCDDGLWCNGTETCNLTTFTCQAGTPPSCADAVACTTDSCNESTDSCDHAPDNAACNDTNVCTDDTCNLTLGCQYANNTASCSDGNACTTGDICSGGACQAGTPVTCNDNVACTTDSCLPASGCQYIDNCTGGQVCNHTTGLCESGSATITFQQGDANAYAGTSDTYIGSGLASQATTNPIVIDNDPLVEQALVRFDGIFGPGANQIPQGSTIVSATLTLRVGGTTFDESPNPVNFHRLLHSWVDTGVWADYGVSPWNTTAGIQADGTDALVTADATATMNALNTSYPVTVTAAVQAWANDPTSNYGWVILPTGTDGLRLQSSESPTVSYRPQLSVTYTPPVTGCTNDPQCDDGLWCNGVETCNLATSTCQAGTPPSCDDGVACTADSCNETTDTCDHGPCPMTVATAGSRYLAVTPPTGLASVALKVSTAGLACLPKYVDASGLLSDVPVFRSSAEWGTVYVRGRPIIPSTAYTVQAEVIAGTPIGSSAATTWVWGDTNNVHGVDLFDILCVQDGSRGVFTKCALEAEDLTGADYTPDGVVNADDIQAVLDGFQSLPYPDSNPCAGR